MKRSASLVLAGMALMFSGFASTEQAKPAGPCAADAGKLCPGMKSGDGKLGPCMKENKDRLSPECSRFIGDFQKAAKEKAQAACGADAAKVCPGMHIGDGKWGPCLKGHQDKLSPSCKDLIGKLQKSKGSRKGKGRQEE